MPQRRLCRRRATPQAAAAGGRHRPGGPGPRRRGEEGRFTAAAQGLGVTQVGPATPPERALRDRPLRAPRPAPRHRDTRRRRRPTQPPRPASKGAAHAATSKNAQPHTSPTHTGPNQSTAHRGSATHTRPRTRDTSRAKRFPCTTEAGQEVRAPRSVLRHAGVTPRPEGPGTPPAGGRGNWRPPPPCPQPAKKGDRPAPAPATPRAPRRTQQNQPTAPRIAPGRCA